MNEPIFDHEKLDVYRLAIDCVAFTYPFEIARGSAWECAAIHEILQALSATDAESNRRGKSELKRIVSMLTRLVQRTDRVAEGAIEYEYRDAEYEYEYEAPPRPEPTVAVERRNRACLDGESTPAAH